MSRGAAVGQHGLQVGGAAGVYLVSILDLGQLGLVSFGQGMPGIDQAQAPVRRVWGVLLGHRGGRHSL